ncbi:hypothetical protein ACVWWR_002697 [Bradyrhizobium sp. LM3.2]
MAAQAPTRAYRGRRNDDGPPLVGRGKGIVESANAAETCGEGDLRQCHAGLVDQALGFLHPPRRCDLARARPGVAHEQAKQVARPDAKGFCKLRR